MLVSESQRVTEQQLASDCVLLSLIFGIINRVWVPVPVFDHFASYSREHTNSAHPSSSVTSLLGGFLLLETTDLLNLLSMISCLAFTASELISTGPERCLPGCRGSIFPATGGGGVENFLAMLCRTLHDLIMLDFLSREPSCAKPSCIRHLKRLFMEPSVIRMTLWIFAWASL